MMISIVTNAYNQGRFLRRCMESVMDQSYRDIEYIVIDPGSTDETPKVLSEYEARDDTRLTIIREPDNGPADGLNKGFARARGDWFAYLNADDFLLPDALRHAAQTIAEEPLCDCIYADGYMTDAQGTPIRRVISTPFDAQAFVWGCALVLQQSTFWKAESFRRVGGFNLDNHTSWDAELLLDMSLAGMRLKHVPGYWSAFVIHPESITGSQRHAAESVKNHDRMFEKVMGRPRTTFDMKRRKLMSLVHRARRPRAAIARLQDSFGRRHLPTAPKWT